MPLRRNITRGLDTRPKHCGRFSASAARGGALRDQQEHGGRDDDARAHQAGDSRAGRERHARVAAQDARAPQPPHGLDRLERVSASATDDIVVGTYAKSGTTWTQQIVGQLVFRGRPDVDVAALSPWLDLRVPPKAVKLGLLEAQTHRRFIKTHLPVDALVFARGPSTSTSAATGATWSGACTTTTPTRTTSGTRSLNDTPGRVGPPIGRPPASAPPVLPRLAGRRRLPVLVLLGEHRLLVGGAPPAERHAAALRRPQARPAGPDAQDRGLPRHPPDALGDGGRGRALLLRLDEGPRRAGGAPWAAAFWEGGAKTFIHKGTNGRWRDVLTAGDRARYEATALQRLGPACARWLAEGGPAD